MSNSLDPTHMSPGQLRRAVREGTVQMQVAPTSYQEALQAATAAVQHAASLAPPEAQATVQAAVEAVEAAISTPAQ
jgi:hypothetical protein